MDLLDRFERNARWLSFPGIIRYLAIFQLLVLGLTFVNPGLNTLLAFNWGKLIEGELWRAITFLFIPVGNLQGTGGVSSALFGFFAAMLLMNFGDGLESRWGTFRTTVYFLSGWLVSLLVSIAFALIKIPAYQVFSPGLLFDAGILFAFATYFPKFEIRLFFILPVPIFVIALITAASIVISCLSVHLIVLCYAILCLLNYLVIAVPIVSRRMQGKVRSQQWTEKTVQKEAFHKCVKCGATEVSHPKRSFRVLANGDEYCDVCMSDTD